MENTRTSIWASIIDFIKSFREIKSSEQGRENLDDIPASYCKGVKVSEKELKELKNSLARLDGEKLEEPEIANGRAGLVAKLKTENAGGNQGKAIVSSNEIKTAEKPDNELTL